MVVRTPVTARGWDLWFSIRRLDKEIAATPWYRIREQLALRMTRNDYLLAVNTHLSEVREYFRDRVVIENDVIIQKRVLPPEDVAALEDYGQLLLTRSYYYAR